MSNEIKPKFNVDDEVYIIIYGSSIIPQKVTKAAVTQVYCRQGRFGTNTIRNIISYDCSYFSENLTVTESIREDRIFKRKDQAVAEAKEKTIKICRNAIEELGTL